MFTVEYGVNGAYRISERTFTTEQEAEAFAARWRESNSIGSYWAEVRPGITERERLRRIDARSCAILNANRRGLLI